MRIRLIKENIRLLLLPDTQGYACIHPDLNISYHEKDANLYVLGILNSGDNFKFIVAEDSYLLLLSPKFFEITDPRISKFWKSVTFPAGEYTVGNEVSNLEFPRSIIGPDCIIKYPIPELQYWENIDAFREEVQSVIEMLDREYPDPNLAIV